MDRGQGCGRYFPPYSKLPAAPEQDMRHTAGLKPSGGAPMGRDNSALSSASSGSRFSENTQYSDSTANSYEDYETGYTVHAETFNSSQLYEIPTESVPRSGFEQPPGYDLLSQETTPSYPQVPSYEQSAVNRGKATPMTLGWVPATELWKLYEVVVADRKVSHLELLPGLSETSATPSIVYLDQLRDQYGYHCLFPGGCKGKQDVFKRPADLDRHQIQVHADEAQKEKYYCTYRRCERSEGERSRPFFRKDHYRDHLRDFHKEDLPGKRFRDKEAKQKWLEERKNDGTWWRCGKCLEKTHVAKDGYTCKRCNIPCEEDRVYIRKQQFGSEPAPVAGVQYSGYSATSAPTTQSFPSYYSNCQHCRGQTCVADIYGGWVDCPVCKPAASLALSEAGNSVYEYRYSETRHGQGWN